MNKASWMATLLIGMLPLAAAIADDGKLSETNSEQLPPTTITLETLLAESAYASRLQMLYPIEAVVSSDDWTRPIDDFEFQDSSALAYLSELRSLSLLTLGEFGHSRLFLGINDQGLLGLHFNVFPTYGDQQYLEVVRMPYLNEDEPVSQAQ